MADWFAENAPPQSSGDWFAQNAPKQSTDRGSEPVSISGLTDTMAGHAKRAIGAAWEYLNPVSMGHAIIHLPTTAQNAFQYTSDAIGRLKEAPNLKEAAMDLAGTIPLAGPQFEQVLREVDQGKYAEAIGHAAALRALSEAPEAIKAAPGAAKSVASAAASIPGKVVDIASKPKIMATAGAATGAAIGHSTGIPYASTAGAALGGMAGKTIADVIGEAKTIPPPEILERLRMTAEDFKKLPEDGKAQVRDLAKSMQTPPIRTVEFPETPPPVGPVSIGETSTTPSKSLPQQIDEYLAERKGTPLEPIKPTTPRVPVWQREGNQPAAIPEGPPSRDIAPQPQTRLLPVHDAASGEIVAYVKPQPPAAAQLAEALTGKPEGGMISPGTIHPPAEAYEGTYRAKRAQILADHFHDAGISYADSAGMTPENLTASQWEALLGKDPETGVQYRTPSQKTIDQARVRLAHKYAAGRSEAARGTAEALAAEMAK